MAKTSFTSSLLSFLFLLLLLSFLAVSSAERLVGGRKRIPDAQHNKKIQDLGSYCVTEYNRNIGKYQHGGANGGRGPVTFVSVVAAEKQVVSGIKYYLTIRATTSSGKPKLFDAEVVVQAWKKGGDSRDLLSFSPIPPTK